MDELASKGDILPADPMPLDAAPLYALDENF
jgi:hypothetical protein